MLFFSSGTIAQQLCRTTLSAELIAERYQFIEDGTVKDLQTQLTWKRCLLGQSFQPGEEADTGQCIGVPILLSWVDALTISKANAGWRLPNLKEIASTAELQCWNPASNLMVFPQETPSSIWSSSPSFLFADASWGLLLIDGSIERYDRLQIMGVRLVKDSN